MQDINLSVPARPDFVHVLRSVTAGTAASLDFSVDEIEDLRLAVDEACAYLIGAASAGARLNMRLVPKATSLEVVTQLEIDGGPEPTFDSKHTIMWHILGALTDEARFDDATGVPAIHMTKRRAR